MPDRPSSILISRIRSAGGFKLPVDKRVGPK